MQNMVNNMYFLNLSAKLEKKTQSFVQNAAQPMFFGLLAYHNYGLFGNVEIVDTAAHSSSKTAN